MKRIAFALGFVAVALMMTSADAGYLKLTSLGEGNVSPGIGSFYYWYFGSTTVSATPAAGWSFSHWEGDFAGKPSSFTYRGRDGDKWSCAVFAPNTPGLSENALVEYAGKYDASTQYIKNSISGEFGYDGYNYSINSQTWRTTAEVDRVLWQHDWTMVKPWFHGDEVLYLVNGGSNPLKTPDPDGTIALAAIALGVIFAQIDQVPNQPLYFADEVNNARTEDEILAYSLDKCLVTGDWEWPVHCAMVKAAIKGMNLVQKHVHTAENFIVIGASKRGWTTWLTAGIDPRVKAIVPLVIDVFRLDQQVEHHWECYGSYSAAIQDYVDFNLFCRIATEPYAQDIQNIVDPYTMIGNYTMPMLIANASGDQFFLPDSSRYYLHELPNWDDMRLRYFPNKDHYMDGVLDDTSTITSLLSWGINTINGTGNPYIDWTIDANGALIVTTSTTPDSVKLWQATNPNARDFRLVTVGPIYTSSTLTQQGNGTYVGYCPPPAQGWTAYFVEADLGSQTYTTEIIVTPDVEPYDDMGCWPVD